MGSLVIGEGYGDNSPINEEIKVKEQEYNELFEEIREAYPSFATVKKIGKVPETVYVPHYLKEKVENLRLLEHTLKELKGEHNIKP